MIGAMTQQGRDLLHALRVTVAAATVVLFLVAVGISLAGGREPPVALTAPTLLVMAWLYRATKQGEEGP